MRTLILTLAVLAIANSSNAETICWRESQPEVGQFLSVAISNDILEFLKSTELVEESSQELVILDQCVDVQIPNPVCMSNIPSLVKRITKSISRCDYDGELDNAIRSIHQEITHICGSRER